MKPQVFGSLLLFLDFLPMVNHYETTIWEIFFTISYHVQIVKTYCFNVVLWVG